MNKPCLKRLNQLYKEEEEILAAIRAVEALYRKGISKARTVKLLRRS